MSCKICSPPGPDICPACEAEIRAQVQEIVRRFRAKRNVIAGLDGRKLLRTERKVI